MNDTTAPHPQTTPTDPSDVPWAPGRLPLLGHARQLIGGPVPLIRSLPGIGPVVRIGFGPQPLYMVCDLELVRQIHLGKAGRFHRDDLIEPVAPFTGRSLVTLSGEEHRTRRRMIAPAFHRNRIAQYAETFAATAERWVDDLPVGEPFDISADCDELAVSTIAATLVGGAPGAEARQVVREESAPLLREATVRTVLPLGLAEARRGAHRQFLARSARMREAVHSVLAAHRRDPVDRGDLLSILAEHVDPTTGQRLDDEAIVDELVGFVMGGIESPAGMLLSLLHELVHAPAARDAAIAEVDEVLGDGPVRAEHAGRLPVVRRMLLETMRLWSPWISLLTAVDEVHLGPLRLAPGTRIGLSAHMVHHDPAHFPEPERFHPDRWLPGHESERTDTATIPFGVGLRNCPADLFSWSALTIQAAALLRRRLPVAAAAGDRESVGLLTKGVGVRPASVPVMLYPR